MAATSTSPATRPRIVRSRLCSSEAARFFPISTLSDLRPLNVIPSPGGSAGVDEARAAATASAAAGRGGARLSPAAPDGSRTRGPTARSERSEGERLTAKSMTTLSGDSDSPPG